MDYVNSLKKRFHRKYVATTPGKCWEWKGYVSKLGYGQLRNVPGERPVVLMAHRLSWELHTKLGIPEGLCVCHKCDNRKCVNPKHMFLGTKTENNMDRDAKVRQARGQLNGNAKMTDKDVLKIRAMSAAGMSNPRIAEQIGLSRITVWEITTRKKWKHLK